MVRYGFGKTRSDEHRCCSSDDSRSSDAALARLRGVAKGEHAVGLANKGGRRTWFAADHRRQAGCLLSTVTGAGRGSASNAMQEAMLTCIDTCPCWQYVGSTGQKRTVSSLRSAAFCL
jgi:hypothetical protein